MVSRQLSNLLVFLICLTAGPLLAQDGSRPEALNTLLRDDFAEDPLWNDGQAEVAAYDASRVLYGRPRPHVLRLITVAEDFNREYYVKADWPYGQKPILPVIKQNQVATIQTPNYPYHYMASVFADRSQFSRTVKLAVSSQEWCGTTYKQFELWNNQPLQVFHSYWDGEGSGRREIAAGPNDFFEEELFLLLRALPFEDGLEARLNLYDNQTTIKAPEPNASPAELAVTEEAEGWGAELTTSDGRRLWYLFDAEYPHVLRSFDHSDGRSLRLQSAERRAYWVMKE